MSQRNISLLVYAVFFGLIGLVLFNYFVQQPAEKGFKNYNAYKSAKELGFSKGEDYQNYIDVMRLAEEIGFSPDDLGKPLYKKILGISNPSLERRVAALKELQILPEQKLRSVAMAGSQEYHAKYKLLAQIRNKTPEMQNVAVEQILSFNHRTAKLASQISDQLKDRAGLPKARSMDVVLSINSRLEITKRNSELRQLRNLLTYSPFLSADTLREFFNNASSLEKPITEKLRTLSNEKRLDYASVALGKDREFTRKIDDLYSPDSFAEEREYKRFLDWSRSKDISKNILLFLVEELKTSELSDFENSSGEINFCTKIWQACEDNADMANNYDGWIDAAVDCEIATENQARYGEPDWGGFFRVSFGSYLTGDSYINNGIATLIESNVKLQNGFGAMVRSRVKCRYDLENEAVLSISVN